MLHPCGLPTLLSCPWPPCSLGSNHLIFWKSPGHAKLFLPQGFCMCPLLCWATFLSALCLSGSFSFSIPQPKGHLLQGAFPACPSCMSQCLVTLSCHLVVFFLVLNSSHIIYLFIHLCTCFVPVSFYRRVSSMRAGPLSISSSACFPEQVPC